MNILFVNPKPLDAYTVYGPSLGLCYLSSYLKEHGITTIQGVDLNLDSPSKLILAIEQSDLVGIYCSTKALSSALEIAKLAKKQNKIVVVGGPHPSVRPEEVLQNPDVDYLILSEGEESFYALMKALEGGGNLSDIDGFGYKINNTLKINPRRNYIKNLDTIPFPDRDLFRFDYSRSVTLCATRGCPYHCANCQPALSLQTCAFRMRSVENVIAELQQVAAGKGVHFIDNDLTVNRKWMVHFCERVLSEKINFTWGCQGRVNTLDRELLSLMKKAGCENIGIGIESGSQKLLDNFLRKQINLEKAKKLIDDSKAVRLPLHGWFIIGIPTETKQEIEQTIDFALSSDLASVGFSIGTPWPGTVFHKVATENNWITANSWGDFNEKRFSRLRTSHWGPEDIDDYREKIIRAFKAKNWNVNEDDFVFTNPYWESGTFKAVRRKIRKKVRSWGNKFFS